MRGPSPAMARMEAHLRWRHHRRAIAVLAGHVATTGHAVRSHRASRWWEACHGRGEFDPPTGPSSSTNETRRRVTARRAAEREGIFLTRSRRCSSRVGRTTVSASSCASSRRCPARPGCPSRRPCSSCRDPSFSWPPGRQRRLLRSALPRTRPRRPSLPSVAPILPPVNPVAGSETGREVGEQLGVRVLRVAGREADKLAAREHAGELRGRLSSRGDVDAELAVDRTDVVCRVGDNPASNVIASARRPTSSATTRPRSSSCSQTGSGGRRRRSQPLGRTTGSAPTSTR